MQRKDLELKFDKEGLLFSYRESAIGGKSTTQLLTYAKTEKTEMLCCNLMNEHTRTSRSISYSFEFITSTLIFVCIMSC